MGVQLQLLPRSDASVINATTKALHFNLLCFDSPQGHLPSSNIISPETTGNAQHEPAKLCTEAQHDHREMTYAAIPTSHRHNIGTVSLVQQVPAACREPEYRHHPTSTVLHPPATDRASNVAGPEERQTTVEAAAEAEATRHLAVPALLGSGSPVCRALIASGIADDPFSSRV